MGLGPPTMNRKMTDLARGSKCGFFAASGLAVGLAALGPTRKFKPGELRRARKLNEVEQMFYVIERVASPAALEVSDEFDDEDYGKMFAAWSEWAQTTAGES